LDDAIPGGLRRQEQLDVEAEAPRPQAGEQALRGVGGEDLEAALRVGHRSEAEPGDEPVEDPAGGDPMRERGDRHGRVDEDARADAVSWAARTTPSATAGATFLLKTLGMMYSSLSSLRLTHAERARAAATFISSLTACARESSKPRKKPGKHSTLLIWFG